MIDRLVPENPSTEWTEMNDKAVSEIMDYIADSHLSVVGDDDLIAKYIFVKLDETYNRKSQVTQLSIKNKLSNFKLENDKSLQNHFKDFEKLAAELSSA